MSASVGDPETYLNLRKETSVIAFLQQFGINNLSNFVIGFQRLFFVL